jgi:hypothetical protein
LATMVYSTLKARQTYKYHDINPYNSWWFSMF